MSKLEAWTSKKRKVTYSIVNKQKKKVRLTNSSVRNLSSFGCWSVCVKKEPSYFAFDGKETLFMVL